MSEKLKDTAIDLLLDGVKKKIDDMRDNHKWQELLRAFQVLCKQKKLI